MAHRTEIDGFSGHLMHPGHGHLHVGVDKRMATFESNKAFRMWIRKRNPRKIAWTEHYRKDHKKSTVDQVSKQERVVRKRVARGYAGVSAAGGAQAAVAVVKQRAAGGRGKK